MKMKRPSLKPLVSAAGTLVWCALNLHAQPAPTIATQPASQTNLVGTAMSFSVTANGTGPLIYQWQFNGTNLPNNIILTTVAGPGGPVYGGDGGPATNAALHGPYGVTFDAFGNLYIANLGLNRVRKVDTSGIITTVAGNGDASIAGDGNGTLGYSGDGGAATNASLYYPEGVACDTYGNLYIADCYNDRIRMVDTNGIITTFAGNGANAPIRGAYSGDGGVATNASLYYPKGVACDVSGNLYIADYGNNRIRKVDTNGIITTVAGNGTESYAGDDDAATNASLYEPQGVALDASGNLYIADYGNNRIRKVDTNGIITTVAGNGPSYPASGSYSGDGGSAINASLNYPEGVGLDAFGNFYIADYDNNRIRKVDTNGIITTVAGNGSIGYSGNGGAATNASLWYPSGVAFDASGNLYIADYFNNRIREVYLAGYPAFALTNVSVTNAGNYTVVITSPYGSVTSQIATLTVVLPPTVTSQPVSQTKLAGSTVSFNVTAGGTGPFSYQWQFDGTNLLQSGTNSALVLPDVSTNNAGNYIVVITNSYGSVTSQVATLTVALPPTVTTQPSSLTNLAGSTVSFNAAAGGTGPFSYQWQFNGTNLPNGIGIITTVAGNGSYNYSGDGGAATNASLRYPEGVAFDAFGNLYIADYGNNCIRKVAANGIITTVAGSVSSGYSGDGGMATKALLYSPAGVAFDAPGNLYIADTYNNRIRKVAANGIITTVAGDGRFGYSGDGGAATNASLYEPQGVAFSATGNLYIADTRNSRIRKVDSNGIITTVASNALFDQPCDLAFSASGDLYIADTYHDCIRKVDTNGIITTVAGKSGSGYSGDGGPATNALLNQPYDLVFDASGDLYIADQGNNCIRAVDTNGIITTVAGKGGSSYLGDGGAATSASLGNPSGVTFDASGNLYIADHGDNRIREVHFSGYPTLVLTNVSITYAGNYTVVITSPYGSVTSAVASLTVIAPPQIITSGASFGFTTNQSGFGFNLSGAVGQTIVVDGSTNLVDWTPLSTNTAGNNPVYFFDPTATNFPGRFYRARLP